MAIANTTIRIKKSVISGNVPSTLANGEIAINSADGKLYYSTPTGSLAYITNTNSFATINASSTLILATSQTDTLGFSGNNGVYVTGNSTSKSISIGLVAPGTSGNVLTSNGTTWISVSPVGGVGTGTVTNVSFTGGLISVGTPTSTPALTVAGTSGGITYFSSASTWASSAALTANALMIGGGTGVAPSTITTGTGVVTALGVAVGSAGAFVTNGGALGTPSSGTVTNLTGTASININGTVGATTANTGAFTNLAYTGTLTGSTGILNIGSGQVYKDASGNMGIGTSSPATKLDIFTSATSDINTRLSNGVTSFLTTASANGGVYQYNIGAYPLIFGTNNTERMRIDSSGNLLVGTTVIGAAGGITMRPNLGGAGTYARITLNHSVVTSSDVFSFEYLGTQVGRINVGTTATAYVTTSDQRLKENIVDAPSALASIKAIQVRSFDWKSTGEHQEYGYIAQELLGVAPEVVSIPTNEDEMMGVDFGRLTPRLVKAIQEQQALIEALTARLEKAGL